MSYFIGSNRLYNEEERTRNNLLLSRLISASGGPTLNKDFVPGDNVEEKTLSEKMNLLEEEVIISQDIINKIEEHLNPKMTLKDFMEKNTVDQHVIDRGGFRLTRLSPINILQEELDDASNKFNTIKQKKNRIIRNLNDSKAMIVFDENDFI